MAVNEENDGNTKKFPYRMLNDLSKKLKSAEDKIASLLDERESHRNDLKMSCNVCNHAVLSESTNEVSTVNGMHAEAATANADALKEEVCQLQKKVAELVYMNNRYHLSISNCTVCTSDDEFSDASLPDEVPIIASTPVAASPDTLESRISPVPCSDVPSSVQKRQADSVMKRKDKDKTFISKMMKTLNKLEAKYMTPEHKRKTRLFTRKQRNSSLVPKEFASIYYTLAAPEPKVVPVPDPFPHVRWSDVRFKPALPTPESCPVYSCSQDPSFYMEKREFRNGSVIPAVSESDFLRLARYNGQPFGSMPGYKTNLGVVGVPTTPVGGYVFCPDLSKWVLHAEPHSSPSVGRRIRQGGTLIARRGKG